MGRNPFTALSQFQTPMLGQLLSRPTHILHFFGSPRNQRPFWDGDEDDPGNSTAGCGGDLGAAVLGGLPLEKSLGGWVTWGTRTVGAGGALSK